MHSKLICKVTAEREYEVRQKGISEYLYIYVSHSLLQNVTAICAYKTTILEKLNNIAIYLKQLLD